MVVMGEYWIALMFSPKKNSRRKKPAEAGSKVSWVHSYAGYSASHHISSIQFNLSLEDPTATTDADWLYRQDVFSRGNSKPANLSSIEISGRFAVNVKPQLTARSG